MIVSATEMLKKAVEGKYAVGQFNINNLEWTKAILLTAQENNSPVILGVSEGAGKYMTGFKTVAAMVKAMVEDFKNQTLPQTATWSLSLWEQSMGLPVNESESVEQRRQNIIEKRRRRNAMNPARIEEIISAMTGADVRMDEYYDKNRFAIYISSIPSLVDELSVRKKLKLIKQSHKVFDIFYEQAIKGDIYVGGVIQKSKEITLEEVC